MQQVGYSQPAGPDHTKITSRRWLFLARAAWLAIAALTIFLFSFGIPAYYRQLQTICTTQPCNPSPTPEKVSELQAAGVSVLLAARYAVALDILVALVHTGVALAIFWRKSDDRMALFVALALLTFGTFGVHDAVKINGILLQFDPGWRIPVYAVSIVGLLSFGLFFFVFPDGRFVPRWPRWPVAAWLAWQVLVMLFPGTWIDPVTWPILANLAYWALVLGLSAYAQIYRFRYVSNYQQRQQTKWVVFGIGAALSGAMLATTVTGLAPLLDDQWRVLALVRDTSYLPFLLLLPLSIGVAILRSRLYDIDVVINRALVYATLTTLLALIYTGLVVGLQAMFRLFTGPTPTLAVIISTLAIVAAFQPLRRSIQGFIDRRFYRRKYDAQQVLASSASRLRDQVDLDDLTRIVLNVVDDTLQPAQVSLVLRDVSLDARQ